MRWLSLMYLHSKSPESETTTVPVCLRASRAVVMVVVMVVDEDMSGSGGGLIRAEMISDYTGGPRLPPRTGAYSGWTLSPTVAPSPPLSASRPLWKINNGCPVLGPKCPGQRVTTANDAYMTRAVPGQFPKFHRPPSPFQL